MLSKIPLGFPIETSRRGLDIAMLAALCPVLPTGVTESHKRRACLVMMVHISKI